MDIKDLIPKDKFDIETAKKLSNYSINEVQPIIPELLEWLQDGNWPVSKPIADHLIPFTQDISLEILQILKSNDGMWKYWILLIFGKTIKNEIVINEIKRIAINPTDDEINDGVNDIAIKITQL